MTDVTPVSETPLTERIASGDAEACTAWVGEVGGADAVRTLYNLSDEERSRLLALAAPGAAAEIIEYLPESQAIDAIEDLDPETAARIIEVLASDDQADLIKELNPPDAEAILGALPVADAAEVRRLIAYDENVAGGLMITEYLEFTDGQRVSDVLAELQANAEAYAKYNIQYSYVVDEQGVLKGVLPMRRLLFAGRHTPITEVMYRNPIRVHDRDPLSALIGVFLDHPFMGLPVVDEGDHLVGVVQRGAIEHALAEEADERYRQSQGIVGGEELRTMPVLLRSRRRLAWLSANIVLNIAAASIIALHQDTLEAVIALAVFLPIISDMSGCSGNQAVAVSMRELTLGVSGPRDLLRVLRKEVSVGILNGLVLGALIALVAFLWKGNGWLGLVVGVALAVNTVIAVAIGGSVPLVLKSMKMDPALASGPVLTTITDMCGFLLVLTLASQLMPWLLA
ncbi:MAG: magnesium transporter [Phycisphaerales bacterium]|nr:magnesium transporter [Phycisphaerales bacterium]